jgi:thioredoxin 1
MAEFYYFSAVWCQPCRAFKPVVQQVVSELGIPMQFIDVDNNSTLTAKFQITSVPAIVVAQNGQVVHRSTGVVSKNQLVSILGQFR